MIKLSQAGDVADVIRYYDHADSVVADLRAFTMYRGDRRCARLAYHELARAVMRMAAALAERYHVRRGDRVAVLMPNGEHTPIVLLAIMALGAVAVPLNPGLESRDWVFSADDCGACGAVVSAELRPLTPALEWSVPFLCTDDELASHVSQDAAPLGHGLDQAPAVILYTSGTTGRPKGVSLSHANLLANGRAMAQHFGLDAHAQLAVLPLHHAHALGFGLMSALVSRGHLVLADRMNAFHWADIIANERVHVTSLVPPLLPFLLKVRAHSLQVPTLKAVLVSSATLSQGLARQFIEQTNIPLVQGWGLSEFTNFATCGDVQGGVDESRRQVLGYPWPSIGRPLPGVDVEVRDSNGSAQPVGVKGELFVRGPSRMLGYFDASLDAPAPDRSDWLATGDEGYRGCDERGPLYFITGRIKDLIIRDAEKVSPLAVEQQLLDDEPQLEGRLAVVGFAHATHGEEIGAYIEAPAGGGDLAVRLVRRADGMRNGLRPKVILWGVRPIPRTHTGKVQRAHLKPLFTAYETYSGPTLLEKTP